MHRGHPGAETKLTKQRAREIVFWQTLTDDIRKEIVMLCVSHNNITPAKRTNQAVSSSSPVYVYCGKISL